MKNYSFRSTVQPFNRSTVQRLSFYLIILIFSLNSQSLFSQTELPNEDFNSPIVDQNECNIDPLESYLFGYQGDLDFSYVELSCKGCEFEYNSNTYSDCITFGNHIDIPALESMEETSELLLATENEIREGMDIYSNPFSEEITISMDQTISAISIYGLNGELVKEVQTNNAKVTLRTNELLPGMYFLQIRTASGLKTYKVIKQ